MRVLLIHQAFVSAQEAGGTRHYELGQRLKLHGDQLSVVASQVSYLTGTPVHPERSGLFYRENLDGIEVLRAFTPAVLHRGFIWRMVAFLSFAFFSAWTALQVQDIDVVMGTTPPIFQAFSAWIVALLRRKPFLLEIRDLWPEFAIDMGVLRNPVLIAAARFGEHALYAGASHILVNSPAYRDYLLRKGIAPEKISFIANGVEVDMFDPAAKGENIRQRYALGDKFVVTYAGAHGPANDLGVVIRAAERLRDDPHIHFLMVGDGKDRPKLETRAQQSGLSNITFTGALPKSLMPDVLAASDACLAILQNIPMFTTTYPNKVFDYMAAARPTVLAIDGVIREVIENSRGGIFVQPGDEDALAAALEELSQHPETGQAMGQSARAYVQKHFRREDQAEAFRAMLQEITARRGHIYQHFKRLFDLLAGFVAFVIALPFMLVIAVILTFTIGRPIIFSQRRPGLNGSPFTLFKFRTMRDTRDANGELLPDAQRMTGIGRFLRSTSLDELPELVNVLKGDMSLVGPRPLLMQYRERYSPEQARRHLVRPGITGWAQINGRNALTWDEKFKLDVWYVDHGSFWLDLRIMGITFWKVLTREGISEQGQVTMTEFLGTTQEIEP